MKLVDIGHQFSLDIVQIYDFALGHSYNGCLSAPTHPDLSMPQPWAVAPSLLRYSSPRLRNDKSIPLTSKVKPAANRVKMARVAADESPPVSGSLAGSSGVLGVGVMFSPAEAAAPDSGVGVCGLR